MSRTKRPSLLGKFMTCCVMLLVLLVSFWDWMYPVHGGGETTSEAALGVLILWFCWSVSVVYIAIDLFFIGLHSTVVQLKVFNVSRFRCLFLSFHLLF